MRLKSTIIFVMVLLYAKMYPQDSHKELIQLIKKAKDTNLVNAYLDLGKQYYYATGEGDSLIRFGKKALKLSQELQNSEKEMMANMFIANGYVVYANDHIDEASYLKAETHLKQGLEVANKIGDIKMQAEFHNKFGALYINQGKKSQAIENRLKAVKLSEKTLDFNNMAVAYYGISLIFAHDEQVYKQLEYINRAIHLLETKKGISPEAQSVIYRVASQQYLMLYEESLNEIQGNLTVKYADRALEVAKANNYKSKTPSSLSVLSDYYFIKEDFVKAEFYAQEALTYNEFLNEPLKLNIFSTLSKIKINKNQKARAYAIIDSVNLLSIKEESYYGSAISNLKFNVYKHFKDYDLAFEALAKKEQFDKKLKEEDQNKVVNELETKYQTELKDIKINGLNQQKKIDTLNIENKQSQIKWLIGLAILAILAALIVFLYFRQRSLKNKQKILETEQRLNRARINPHFFFNAMASLQNVALQEKSTKTTLYTSRLAKIMRQSLESTYDEMVTVEKEIDFLTQYLEIQKLRYPEKFEYEFLVDDNLEINELKLPGMLMQPFVENAIEHGFKDLDYKGKLSIAFKENAEELLVIVEDNGKGINGIEKEKTHKSRAMQIIKDRLYLFNKQHRSDAKYKIEHTNEGGFKITVNLPKLY